MCGNWPATTWLWRARAAARARHARDFRWEDVLTRYEALLFGKVSSRVAAE